MTTFFAFRHGFVDSCVRIGVREMAMAMHTAGTTRHGAAILPFLVLVENLLKRIVCVFPHAKQKSRMGLVSVRKIGAVSFVDESMLSRCYGHGILVRSHLVVVCVISHRISVVATK